MPPTRRILMMLSVTAASLAARNSSSFVSVGDDAGWAAVGAVLTGVSYGCVKVLDRLQGRSRKDQTQHER